MKVLLKMKKIGIFFGTYTGNTRRVATQMQREFGENKADLHNIAKTLLKDMEKYPFMVFDTSTWGRGELQDDWNFIIDELGDMDFKGRKIALFGTGNPIGSPGTFVDALGILYETLVETGAEIVGETPANEYIFNSSKAQRGNHLVGLALDTHNDEKENNIKIKKWVESLKIYFQ
jgi:flavodoxin I